MTEFTETYASFIERLGRIAERRLHGKTGIQTLVPTLTGIINEGTDAYAKTNIDYACSQLDPATRERLLHEMEFFIERTAQNDHPTRDDVESGEVVKENLEDLLGGWLPDWLKKLFKILSEILKLTHGA